MQPLGVSKPERADGRLHCAACEAKPAVAPPFRSGVTLFRTGSLASIRFDRDYGRFTPKSRRKNGDGMSDARGQLVTSLASELRLHQ